MEQLFLFDMEEEPKKPTQFSLRRLFAVVTFTAVLLSVFQRIIRSILGAFVNVEKWFYMDAFLQPISWFLWLFNVDLALDPIPRPGTIGVLNEFIMLFSMMLGLIVMLVAFVFLIWAIVWIRCKLWKWSELKECPT